MAKKFKLTYSIQLVRKIMRPFETTTLEAAKASFVCFPLRMMKVSKPLKSSGKCNRRVYCVKHPLGQIPTYIFDSHEYQHLVYL